MSPATAIDTNIKTANTVESHLIRVNSGVKQFIGRVYQSGKSTERMYAYSFWTYFGQKITCAIEIESIPNSMLTITSMR